MGHGLEKITEYGLHHKDFTARSILLGQYNISIHENTKVKITDFGMTRKNDNNGKIGSYKWMAPESIENEKIYNEKTDVYMFGVTIWEIMYGKEPYQKIDGI